MYRLVSPEIDVAPEPMRSEAMSSVVADLVVVVGTTDDDDEDADADVGVDGGAKANRRSLGSGGLAARAARRCASPDSHGRLAELLVEAISAEVAAVATMMEEEGDDGDDGDDDDDDDDLRALCRALCRTLCLSGNASLAEKCGTSLLSKLFAVAAVENADDARNAAPPPPPPAEGARNVRGDGRERRDRRGLSRPVAGVVPPPPSPRRGVGRRRSLRGEGDIGATFGDLRREDVLPPPPLLLLVGRDDERSSPAVVDVVPRRPHGADLPPTRRIRGDIRRTRLPDRRAQASIASREDIAFGRIDTVVVLLLRRPPPPPRAETTVRSRFAAAAAASSSRRILTWCRP